MFVDFPLCFCNLDGDNKRPNIVSGSFIVFHVTSITKRKCSRLPTTTIDFLSFSLERFHRGNLGALQINLFVDAIFEKTTGGGCGCGCCCWSSRGREGGKAINYGREECNEKKLHVFGKKVGYLKGKQIQQRNSFELLWEGQSIGVKVQVRRLVGLTVNDQRSISWSN